MRQLDIFEFVLEHKEVHVALRIGSGRTTPNEDFRVVLCLAVKKKKRILFLNVSGVSGETDKKPLGET